MLGSACGVRENYDARDWFVLVALGRPRASRPVGIHAEQHVRLGEGVDVVRYVGGERQQVGFVQNVLAVGSLHAKRAAEHVDRDPARRLVLGIRPPSSNA